MASPTQELSLPSLPNELIYDIAGYLELLDLRSLLESNRQLYTLLKSVFEDFISESPGLVLHWALPRRQERLLRLAVNKGARLDGTNDDEKTALHVAAELGWEEIITLFLDLGADIDSMGLSDDGYCSRGDTPLLLAASAGHEAAARLLIARGANTHITGSSCNGLLDRAIKGGSLGLVEYLLDEEYCDVDTHSGNFSYTALHSAANYGRLAIMEMLTAGISAITNPDEKALSQFSIADPPAGMAEGGKRPLRSANINAQDSLGRTALLAAISHNHMDIAQLLLKRGADVNISSYHETVITEAVIGGNPTLVKMILECGAGINSSAGDSGTALSRAIKCNNVAITELLLQYGAEVDIQQKEGESVLFEAVRHGSVSLVKAILHAGANPNIRDKNDVSVLHYAMSKTKPILDILLEYGIDINHRSYGISALHTLIKTGLQNPDQEIVLRQLLERGIDIHVRDPLGRTALHWAANGFSPPSVVECLLSFGADPGARDNTGDTPGQLALIAFPSVPGILKILYKEGFQRKHGSGQKRVLNCR